MSWLLMTWLLRSDCVLVVDDLASEVRHCETGERLI